MQTVSDNQLRDFVVREIDREAEVTSTDIAIAADAGVVSLSGFVHGQAEKVAAHCQFKNERRSAPS